MANPRTATDYSGINAHYTTYLSDGSTIVYSETAVGGSTAVGKAVSLSANRTAKLAADAEHVVGKLILVEPDGKCNVQDGGYCQLPSSGTVTRGTGIVGALLTAAPGYIRSAVSATAAEAAIAKGEIIDVADTAAVWVNLG